MFLAYHVSFLIMLHYYKTYNQPTNWLTGIDMQQFLYVHTQISIYTRYSQHCLLLAKTEDVDALVEEKKGIGNLYEYQFAIKLVVTDCCKLHAMDCLVTTFYMSHTIGHTNAYNHKLHQYIIEQGTLCISTLTAIIYHFGPLNISSYPG